MNMVIVPLNKLYSNSSIIDGLASSLLYKRVFMSGGFCQRFNLVAAKRYLNLYFDNTCRHSIY